MQTFRDPRIRILQRGQPGAGGYAARNLGLKEAQGSWVAFLDADDAWYPEHLDRMYSLSRQYPDVFFMGSGWETAAAETSQADTYYLHNRGKNNHTLTVADYLINALHNQGPVCTDVVCVKLSSPVAQGLFPQDTQARRGGDLHAWLKLICHHRHMAWSSHIGAIYFRDSFNMVTKSVPASLALLQKSVYRELSASLTSRERGLLKKYLNRRIGNALMLTVGRADARLNLPGALYWQGDFFTSLRLLLVSLIPGFAVRSLKALRKNF
jgi:glycosyltransferase involved in cell wall biosynthesis